MAAAYLAVTTLRSTLCRRCAVQADDIDVDPSRQPPGSAEVLEDARLAVQYNSR